MKIVRQKHNVMISFSVGSGHPGKYSYEGKLRKIKRYSWEKLSVIASLIWFLFFKQRFPFSHMLPLFQDNFILVEATSSRFFRVTTSTQQLLFRGSSEHCCFLLFQNSHFFAGVIFSEQLLFRSENSTEQPLLENRKFFTALTFRNSSFFRKTCLG